MQFSEILASAPRGGDGWTVSIPDSWLQGRSAFGGLQAAISVRAMQRHVPSDFALRVVQTTFVAPVPPGEVHVRSRLLRSGKSAAHVESRLLSRDGTAALAVGVFGAKRPSRVRVTPVRPPVDASAPFDLQFVPGVSPGFVQHFSLRWLSGGVPFTNTPATEAFMELGMPGEEATSLEHVMALADAVPPVALAHLDAPARGSSATWTFEMLTDRIPKSPVRGFRADATLVAARDGYTSQSVMLWGPDGDPLALSRQSMFVFG